MHLPTDEKTGVGSGDPVLDVEMVVVGDPIEVAQVGDVGEIVFKQTRFRLCEECGEPLRVRFAPPNREFTC